jgi:hypothetical protein
MDLNTTLVICGVVFVFGAGMYYYGSKTPKEPEKTEFVDATVQTEEEQEEVATQ